MHVAKHFQETRVEVIHALVHDRPFATLITLGADGIGATHLPFVLDPEPAPYGTLRGHVARVDPAWREVGADRQALAIFQGPDAYVSPNWYPSKQETGKAVPTWNFLVVHAHGVARAIEDPVWLRAHLEELADRHERGRDTPWRVSDAPADYTERLMNGIVGIEMPIGRLIGKWKVSQNRSAADRDGVIEGLHKEGTDDASDLARLVREFAPE